MTRPVAPPPHRWIGIAALGLVIAVVCTLLGSWQWSRHEVKSATVQRIETNYDAAPVPLQDLLPDTGTPFRLDHEWRPVTVTGSYLPDRTVLLRNRPVSGQPGYHVLVPFAVADDGTSGTAEGGPVLLVDRGWVPTDYSGPAQVPDPPSGPVQLTVHLRPSESASTRDAPPGQVQAVSVPQVLAAGSPAADVPQAYDAYGVLAEEDPAPAEGIVLLPRPSMDLRSSLAYAFQWWALALGALIAFGIVANRERLEIRRGQDGATGAQPPPPPRRRRPRRATAEEEEDALVDAQLR